MKVMLECKVCHREPKDISEYIHAAEDEQCTPEEFVRSEEGTYNCRTQLFYCTECYIKIGMTLGKA
jgi:hypothetical protein